jgi:N-acetylglucosaminyl-diphospho-decaprenol L-rhamnosyltransferase
MTVDVDVDVTVLIVNYNTANLLQPCLTALHEAKASLTVQTVIVDNASRDDSAAVLRRDHADCELVFNNVNVGFGRANNQALALARGRFVLLLNTDAFVPSNALTEGLRFLDAHPRCAIVGARLVGRDGVLQPSWRYFPTPWTEFLAATGLARLFPGTRMVDDMTWDHASAREGVARRWTVHSAA